MCRFDPRIAIVAAIGLWAAVPASQAAWLGYKNETTAPIVVQTTMVINKQVVRGKAHVLYPGEIAWDNIPAPSTRTLSIYDPKASNKLIHQDTVTVANQDIFLGVQSVKPPAQPGKPAPPAVIRLAVTRAPVAPGVVPNKPAAAPGPSASTPGKPGTPAPTKPGVPAAPNPSKPIPPASGKTQEPPKPNTPAKSSK